MTLEEEMKLWDERANDKVGKLIDLHTKRPKTLFIAIQMSLESSIIQLSQFQLCMRLMEMLSILLES